MTLSGTKNKSQNATKRNIKRNKTQNRKATN